MQLQHLIIYACNVLLVYMVSLKIHFLFPPITQLSKSQETIPDSVKFVIETLSFNRHFICPRVTNKPVYLHGLPPGNYTLTLTDKRYSPESYSVTIPGMIRIKLLDTSM